MKSNLATLGEHWKQQWLAEGEAEALACLLAQRLGALTPSLRERIQEAKPTTVECSRNSQLPQFLTRKSVKTRLCSWVCGETHPGALLWLRSPSRVI
jgi:hypothetical protein